ncbi:MAG: enoyl-CoA hydratase/isomerase family protein, partial [Gammaproteobacteria bacterium]
MNEYTVIEKHDGWAEVVLSRPARKNAIVPPMAIEVATAVNGLSTQQDVAAIVIRGADGAFCSGVDLKVLQAKEGDADYLGEWDGEALREMHYALYRSAKPLIGVLERFAINAG